MIPVIVALGILCVALGILVIIQMNKIDNLEHEVEDKNNKLIEYRTITIRGTESEDF